MERVGGTDCLGEFLSCGNTVSAVVWDIYVSDVGDDVTILCITSN